MARPPVLVCIHGLGNKPPRDVLAAWWLSSIRESFRLFDVPEPRFRFEMVYWADLVHELPLDPAAPQGNPLAVERPYERYKEPPLLRKPSELRLAVRAELERLIDRVAFDEKHIANFDRISDVVIRALFRDLEIYTYGTCVDRKKLVRPACDAIQDELAATLRKHTRDRVVLLSHSMGTMIAYDVLANPRYGLSVESLVTIGSPLGLPPVMRRLRQYDSAGSAGGCRTPEGVRSRWINLSDLEDQVAFNYDLADDFAPNSRGVRPQDVVVFNTWRDGRKRDPHNIFGYTRTPEAAATLAELLAPSPREGGRLVRIGLALRKLLRRGRAGGVAADQPEGTRPRYRAVTHTKGGLRRTRLL